LRNYKFKIVEKNQTNLFTAAKVCFIILLSHSFCTLHAQKQKKIKFEGRCGYFYQSIEHIHKVIGREVVFYDFKPGEVVASIGAQCCNWEAALAAVTDSVLFYLEDIDSIKFTKEQTAFAWNYYATLRGRPMTSNYKMILGDEKSTSLPENVFDKILIINSFHEFTFPTEMLADIKKKLKPGGILYIDEALPKRHGQLHGICNMPMLSSDQMIQLFSKNGFEYVDGLDFNYRQKNPVRKIFAFKIKE